MMKRRVWLIPHVCIAVLFPVVGEAAEPLAMPPMSPGVFLRSGQTNGGWAAWVEARLVGNPLARALTYEQQLHIRGPSTNAPRLLFTQASTGWIHYWLGPDGVLAFQGGIPSVVFPGREEPLLLEAPRPAKTNDFFHPPYWGLDNCWFSGGALLYESYNGYGGTDYLMGFFLLDATNKTVSAGSICVELKRPRLPGEKNPEHPGDNSPHIYPGRIVFVGTHVLWMNQGWPHDLPRGTPTNHWRTQQLRAFELESKRLMSGEEIPGALLAKHKEAIDRISGPRAGTGSVEAGRR